MRVRLLITVAAVAAVGCGGCGVGDDREEARAVTERFYAAIESDDGAAACEQLSEDTIKQLESQSGQECARAVTDLRLEGGSVEHVEVYATNGKVDVSSGESAFLSSEPAGWRLSAVGCTPEEGKPRDRPFDCELQA